MMYSIIMGLVFGILTYFCTNLYLKEKNIFIIKIKRFTILIIVMIGIFTINYMVNGLSLISFMYSIISSFLVIIFVVDCIKMIIPDTLNIGIFLLTIILILVFKKPLYISKIDLIIFLILNTLITIIVLGAFLCFKIEVLGFGDIKLFFSIGILLGCFKFLVALFIASFVAVIVECLIFRFKRKMIPFGPYLVVGFIIVIIFEKYINFHQLFILFLTYF